MKLFARPKSLADTMAPLMIIIRLLGLRAFEFRGRPKYIISLIYLLLLYVFYCSTLHMQHWYYSNVKFLKLESMMYKFFMYLTTVSVLTKLLLGWWFSEVRIIYKTINSLSHLIYEKSHFHICRNSKFVNKKSPRLMKRCGNSDLR